MVCISIYEPVCDTMERSSPGAQTERRGDAGPVRDLLAVRPHQLP
jgi:hypothetical protein